MNDKQKTFLDDLRAFLLHLQEVLPQIFPRSSFESDTIPKPMDKETKTVYLWDTPDNVRHSIRVICDEECLSVKQKNELSATLHCESNWNPKCVHPNVVGGKVLSTDYGLCQINDYYHIGQGKDFPSSDYVLNNPEACVRWMCKQWKAGNAKLWVCYSKGLYEKYAA